MEKVQLLSLMVATGNQINCMQIMFLDYATQEGIWLKMMLYRYVIWDGFVILNLTRYDKRRGK